MRVLVLGSGAREHALVASLARDAGVTAIACAPGNPGIGTIAELLDVDITSGPAVVAAARGFDADLVVIGPEVPLVLGVADDLRDAGIATFGPSEAAARIEGSKAFAKDVMAAAGVPTARAEVVDSIADLDAALDRFGPIWVVKDDALAAGKGVVVTEERPEARAHAAALLDAGHPVLLESYLDGPEVSLFAFVDGETVVPLLPAQDHKRVGEGDTGPNTGGMGAYAPLPWLEPAMVARIVGQIVEPTAKELARRGAPFSGLLYTGLAMGKAGPAVVEFNCRFGDPETQAVLALLETPLAGLLMATADGTLADQPAPVWRKESAVTVVLAAENYPGRPRTGDPITGADAPGVFQAGTALVDGTLVSAGGRVLSVVGTGADLAAARADAYRVMAGIKLTGSHFRGDIGLAAADGRITVPDQLD